jgi:CopA family copper-resistance protein
MKNREISRRKFIKKVVATSLIATTPILFGGNKKINKLQKTQKLKGREFFLEIGKSIVNYTGKTTIATTVNNMLPAPTLIWKEGEEITLHVTNKLNEDSSIHWHGIILPNEMDGVPGLTFDGIKPNETFTYKFTVTQSGTYWYHSHSGFQEQTGVHGVIVIEPKVKDPYDYDEDYVVSLSDWTDENPNTVYRKLKVKSNYYNRSQRTIGDFIGEVKDVGFTNAFNSRKMWNEMSMTDRDLSDVAGSTYKYLMNGHTNLDSFMAIFKKGQKIRLRFVNSSAMTFFDVRVPNLKMKVVAADGNNIEPVTIDEFRIGVAETYDVIVYPTEDIAYAIFAQSIDRSGYALGNLSYNQNVKADVPDLDPIPNLSHVDMGMNMSGMSCGSMMNMSKDKQYSGVLPKKIPITKLETKWGVQTTMIAKSPRYRLDDPGVGLRNNGRRVLTYSDLRSPFGKADQDKYPDREIILQLTGNMERYMWSINGISYKDAKPLKFFFGERLRITFINNTMMNHPMHLHGLWSDLETADNQLVRKHTIIVQPGSKVSVRVTVNAKGNWAFHCHMLYHMLGMFRKVVVS